MTDLLDERLATGATAPHDDQVLTALSALAADRAAEARVQRRRRVLLPVATVGALMLGAAGAAAATTWGPWTYVTDPDIVIAHDWTDVDGRYLGTCESHLATGGMSPEVRADARAYLDALDLYSIEPDAESVAALLNSVGRLDEVGRLVPGAVPGDFEVSHQGDLMDAAVWTDARILQDALAGEVFSGMARALQAEYPELEDGGVSATIETQCSTDPADAGGE